MRMCTCTRSLSDDYDKMNPCFFESEAEEELYDAAPIPAPGPGEDIWKKFELLPTPPRSPKHETNYQTLVPSTTYTLDKLQLVSDILEDQPFHMNMEFSMFPEDCAMCKTMTPSTPTQKNASSLKMNLIQDCMWSGLNLAKDLKIEGKSTDSNNNTNDKQNGSTSTSTHTTKSTNSCSNIHSSMDINSTTECVDPTAVFPYPLNDARENLGAETPSDSEDEDEEIDVVTVNDKVQITRRKPILPAATSMSAQVAAMHNYTAPAPTSPRPVTVHFSPARSSYSNATSPTSSPKSSPVRAHKRARPSNHSLRTPPIKKIKISLPKAELQSMVQKLNRHHRHSYHHHHHGGSSGSSSRSSSDSEDGECRRSQHNVLERKRRNELKYSFHTLRDNVPDLGTQEKAPKVVILKKATDYILKLRRTDKFYCSELKQLQQRQEQLKRRLSALHRM